MFSSRAHIGNIGRNTLEARAEGVGEAQHRAVHIETREHRAHANHVRRKGRQQRLERFLHLEHDARTAFDDQRHVTAHLDRIPEPLLGVHEERLAANILALPLRLAKRPQGNLRVASAPAPLEIAPAGFEIAEDELRERAIEMRGGVARIESDRLRIRRDRFGMPIERGERDALEAQRGNETRARGQHAIVVGERFVDAAEHAQGDAPVAERFGVVRVQRERTCLVKQRFIGIAGLDRDRAQQVQREKIRGLRGDERKGDIARLVEAPRAEKPGGALQGRVGLHGVTRWRRASRARGPRGASLPA